MLLRQPGRFVIAFPTLNLVELLTILDIVEVYTVNEFCTQNFAITNNGMLESQ